MYDTVLLQLQGMWKRNHIPVLDRTARPGTLARFHLRQTTLSGTRFLGRKARLATLVRFARLNSKSSAQFSVMPFVRYILTQATFYLQPAPVLYYRA